VVLVEVIGRSWLDRAAPISHAELLVGVVNPVVATCQVGLVLSLCVSSDHRVIETHKFSSAPHGEH